MSQPHGAAGVTLHVTPRSDEPKAIPASPKEAETAVDPTAQVESTALPESAEPSTASTPPIPTMGFPAFLWSLKSGFNKNAIPPKLSKKEIAYLEEQARLAEQARLEREAREERLRLEREELERRNQRAKESYFYIRKLTDRCPHLRVTFIQVKGAGATTTTMVNVASRFAEDTRTLVYGADFNPASGTAGARLGKEFGETISIQEFAEIVEQVKGNRKEVNARLRPTRYGVRVLSADDYTEIPGEQYGTTTARMLDVLDENCDYLLLDTPNDITTPAARAVLAKTDIFVFTANVRELDSLRLLRTSMDTVRKLGHGPKVTNSVVVISNVPEGKTLDDYQKYLGQVNLNHEVTRPLQPGEFRGQMLLVPHDPQIALNREVDLDALNWATTQAYRDIDIAIFEQALDAQPQHALSIVERS